MMMKKSVGFFLLQLLVATLLPLPLSHPAHGATGADSRANCEINAGPCSQKSGELLVTLEIAPKPVKVMQDLAFTVTVKGGREYDHLKLDLQMIGMQMGLNEVTLTRTGPGTYRGKGVIPRCHSGKKLWSATLSIPGQTPDASFRFHVLY